MKKNLLVFLTIIFTSYFVNQAHSQGVTTAAIQGAITNAQGEPLPGATVIAIHEPSGTQYGATTRIDGEYNLPAVKVGGPYTLTASFVGYQTQKLEKVYLSLGQDITFDFKLTDVTTDLGITVEVKASKDNVLNANRTGAVTNVTTQQIERATSLNRNIQDITRLTPQASTSNFGGFGGKSNLFNNFSVDGAMFNNAFGLSDLPGGQTNSTPISMDAIQEFQISMAPYDVRQSGFTGAGVNAITRSGTNSFTGSVYTFFRNQNLNGKKVKDQELTNNEFTQNQYGMRLGGPIIKNKLFFFVNAEMEKRTDPTVFLASRPELSGTNIANVQGSDLDKLRDTLLLKYGYDPGTYENYKYIIESRKILVRLDWNISKNHKFTIRNNYMISSRINNPSTSGANGGRGPDVNKLPFSNSNYIQNQNMNSTIFELNSVFGNKFSNTLQVGYNMFRDFRESNSTPFPLVDIELNGQTLTSFGYESFSPNNKLDQDHFQFSDHFTFYTKKHILSFGTANEFFMFTNGFTPNFYGRYRFASLADFYTNKAPTLYQLQYSAIAGVDVPMASYSVFQLGLYAQDEWTPVKRLKLTAGLRMDMPIFTSSLDKNPTVESLVFTNGETIDVSQFPKANPLWSPRLGFNWDVKGNRTTQVRGGTGIFTGRVPYTWIAGQASNNGLLFGEVNVTSAPQTSNYLFSPDIKKYVPANATVPSTVLINATSPNFKFPQVFRTNLAIDQKLPWDLVATIEGIYTKDINAIFHRNANLKEPIGIVEGDGRPRFGVTDNDRRINPNITNAIVLDNTSQGYQWSITGQLQKIFTPNFQTSIAYNYGDARDLTSSSSAIAANAFTGNQIVGNPNDPVLSYTNFLQRHRVIGSLTYRKEYAKHFATSITLFYEARSGRHFSYAYGGDLNSDGITGNDLMYIPKTQNEIVLTTVDSKDTRSVDEIWNQLDQYIEQDPYLSKHRGEYAARNAAVTPWVFRLDARLLQDFYLTMNGKKHTLQLSVDIQNLGNFLNSNWGVLRDINRTQLLNFVGYEGPNNTGRPTFSFPLFNSQPLLQSFRDEVGLISRWQMQIGIRYIFN